VAATKLMTGSRTMQSSASAIKRMDQACFSTARQLGTSMGWAPNYGLGKKKAAPKNRLEDP
jgi:hypothetical protein